MGGPARLTNRVALYAVFSPLAAVALLSPAPEAADLSVRLRTAVSTSASHAGDPVEATVTAPAALSGAILRGTVEEVVPPTSDGGCASLLLRFTRLEAAGERRAIRAHVVEVDNAREEVDGQGRITGAPPSSNVSGRLDDELRRLGAGYSGLASVLSAVRHGAVGEAFAGVSYAPGVELTVRLDEPAGLPPDPPAPAFPNLEDARRVVEAAPLCADAERPARPSDLINLLLVGSEKRLRRAFLEAGWSPAAKLSGASRMESLRALAEDRGYPEAPVSLLRLEGRPPDLVFQKSNNTLARRHHVRLWRRPGSLRGQPVWAAAATHDIGIGFLDQERVFFHHIDARIDRERQKVLDDLRFTGRVAALAMVERPNAPRRAKNATGDDVETDGRIAVLSLR